MRASVHVRPFDAKSEYLIERSHAAHVACEDDRVVDVADRGKNVHDFLRPGIV
jgi:hypothetical protein